MMYENQEGGDVNAVRFFPSGEALATACNDGSVSLYMCVYQCTLLMMFCRITHCML